MVTTRIELENDNLFNLTRNNYDGSSRTPLVNGDRVGYAKLSDAIPDGGQGDISFVLNSGTGLYNVTIAYFNEDDGEASVDLKANGTSLIGSPFTFTGGIRANPKAINYTVASLGSNLLIADGSTLVFEGTRDGNEFAAVDYLEFTAVKTGTVQFSQASFEVTEGDTLTATLTRSGGSVGEVNVTASVPGLGNVPITFADGEVEKTFLIPVPDDDQFLGDQTLSATLTSSDGALFIGAADTASVTILDNDQPTDSGDPTGGNDNASGGNDNTSGGSDNTSGGGTSTGGNGGSTSGDDNGVVDDVIGERPIIVRATQEADTLKGNGLDNKIRGKNGNDTLKGKSGDDFVSGNKGDDVLHGNKGDDTVRGRIGNDEINGGGGDDQLNGDRGDDVIKGGSGNDFIKGGAGRDDLSGGKGKDELIGNGKNDIINGGGGSDTIVGGFGKDTITTGSGRDVIVYNRMKDATDVITDFSTKGDRLDLSKMVDLYNLDASMVFDENISVVQRGSTAVVKFDRDGNGSKKGVNLVNLEDVSASAISADVFIF